MLADWFARKNSRQYSISNTYVFIFRLFRFLNNFIELFTLWVGYSKKSVKSYFEPKI